MCQERMSVHFLPPRIDAVHPLLSVGLSPTRSIQACSRVYPDAIANRRRLRYAVGAVVLGIQRCQQILALADDRSQAVGCLLLRHTRVGVQISDRLLCVFI